MPATARRVLQQIYIFQKVAFMQLCREASYLTLLEDALNWRMGAFPQIWHYQGSNCTESTESSFVGLLEPQRAKSPTRGAAGNVSVAGRAPAEFSQPSDSPALQPMKNPWFNLWLPKSLTCPGVGVKTLQFLLLPPRGVAFLDFYIINHPMPRSKATGKSTQNQSQLFPGVLFNTPLLFHCCFVIPDATPTQTDLG